MPVDMRAKPYYLDDEAVQWVEDTIASMSLEEKIGQLFFNMGSSRTEEYLKMTVDKYHIGGIRYNPGTAAEVHEQNRIVQENSKIPLIIACNTENGGNGACSNGTMIAHRKDRRDGRRKIRQSSWQNGQQEAAAIGCNLSFAPVSDIYQLAQPRRPCAPTATIRSA
ncbi:MAG: glycoside hydrolase family 3 N-terminal domain-containing protein [Ruthenibacterium lactatiformans]